MHPPSLVDCGDYVVVTNARRIKVSGKKQEQKLYRKHTMYPGALKENKYEDVMEKKPHEVRRVSRFSVATCTQSRADHHACGLWYAAQKQAARPTISAPEGVRWLEHGHLREQYLAALGRRHSNRPIYSWVRPQEQASRVVIRILFRASIDFIQSLTTVC